MLTLYTALFHPCQLVFYLFCRRLTVSIFPSLEGFNLDKEKGYIAMYPSTRKKLVD